MPELDLINQTINFLRLDEFAIKKEVNRDNSQKRTNVVVNESGSLFNGIQHYITSSINQQIRKLSKLHKDNSPIRPVFSFITAPCTKLRRLFCLG